MRGFYTFFTILVSVVITAQSPITLANTNMPGSGDTLRFTNVNPASIGNYTQTGSNFNWNFGTVTSLTEGVRTFKSALSTPYALFFASFTGFAEKMPDVQIQTFPITDYYNFYKKQTTPTQAFIADGVGLTINGIPLPSYYTDKDELYIFPMSFPQYDSTKFRFSTPTTTLLPIRYIKTGYRVTKVDGFGTVTTPFGTESCLRLITTQYGTDSIKGLLSFAFPNVQRSYQWMTLNSRIPYFEVSGAVVAGVFTPTQVRYRGFQKELPNPVGISGSKAESGLQVFPNPVANELIISGTAYSGVFTIYDLNGKVVLSGLLSEMQTSGVLDVSTLSKGIYCLTVFTEEGEKTHKFIKE